MIQIEPIATVRNNRDTLDDDNWGDIVSEIVLDKQFTESALKGIEEFSHLEIIFYFHQMDPNEICRDARVPRHNPAWPEVGVFAQRCKHHPNTLGLTTVELIRREGTSLFVKRFDAVDGTPVIDIKPVVREFLPHNEVKQPRWVSELMTDYWKAR